MSSEYRHITNLRTPFEPVDIEMMEILSDYRLGAPVPVREGMTLAQLVDAGIVGLYTTEEVLREPAVRSRTGWLEPDKVLGKEWAA